MLHLTCCSYFRLGCATCAKCPKGTYGNDTGLETCHPCPKGNFKRCLELLIPFRITWLVIFIIIITSVVICPMMWYDVHVPINKHAFSVWIFEGRILKRKLVYITPKTLKNKTKAPKKIIFRRIFYHCGDQDTCMFHLVFTGSFSNETASLSCMECSEGFYQTLANQSACAPCPICTFCA